MRIRIQHFMSMRIRIHEVQAKGEAINPHENIQHLKRDSLLYSFLVSHFLPSWIRIRIRMQSTKVNPGAMWIRIQKTLLVRYRYGA